MVTEGREVRDEAAVIASPSLALHRRAKQVPGVGVVTSADVGKISGHYIPRVRSMRERRACGRRGSRVCGRGRSRGREWSGGGGL